MKGFLFFTVFFLVKYSITIELNNVCKTFEDYRQLLISSNCWYNPDVTATTPDLIMRYGYPLEIYEAITKDHYILTIFRIPPKNKTPKGVVFLQHPAFCSSSVWADLGNQSFSFLLSDAGYDVWLGNFRGTIYSRNNLYLSHKKNSNKYWNFSFHEYGIYDLPAQIDLIRKETKYKYKICYIGHSVATSAGLIYTSLLPRHAKNNTELFILLSPMAFMGHEKSILRLLSPYSNMMMRFSELTRTMSGPTYHGLMHTSVELFCMNVNMKLCVDGYKLLYGPDPQNIDASWFPVMLYQSFAGFPMKAVVHNGQINNAYGRFQWFDYGEKLNLYYYHKKQPPVYPIKNITVPIYIWYGGQDYMADKYDVLYLYERLRPEVKYGIREIKHFDHMNFQYGKRIRDILYMPLLEIINGFNEGNRNIANTTI